MEFTPIRYNLECKYRYSYQVWFKLAD